MKKFILPILFLFLFVDSTHAAKIYFEPAEKMYEVGESFSINIRLDTQGEEINALDLGILYPPLFEVKSISKTGSTIQLWVQDPNFTSTGVFISGGSPGGIRSSNALIAKINFKAKAIGDGGLQLTPASSVLLNDGQGTSVVLSAGAAIFRVNPLPKKGQKDEATPTPKETLKITPLTKPETKEDSKEEAQDKTKPKKFKVFVGQDPRVFDSKHFISFFTTDSKSGVEHYEIKEGDGGEYKIAKSPYLLSDQGLKTVVRVRAYDGVGNYQETVYPGPIKRLWLWILRLF